MSTVHYVGNEIFIGSKVIGPFSQLQLSNTGRHWIPPVQLSDREAFRISDCPIMGLSDINKYEIRLTHT